MVEISNAVGWFLFVGDIYSFLGSKILSLPFQLTRNLGLENSKESWQSLLYSKEWSWRMRLAMPLVRQGSSWVDGDIGSTVEKRLWWRGQISLALRDSHGLIGNSKLHIFLLAHLDSPSCSSHFTKFSWASGFTWFNYTSKPARYI